jgi:hypothetical protein
MKIIYTIALSLIMELQLIAQETSYYSMLKSDEGKAAVTAMTQKAAAHDIRGLIDALPGLELLWKQEPLAYIQAVKASVRVLNTSSDPEAAKASLAIFPNIINKTSPPGTEEAYVYFGQKSFIVMNYFNLREVRENRQWLLLVADFISEVRARRIPDYRNKGTKLPERKILEAAGVHSIAELPTAALKEAAAQAILQNKEDMKMNGLQNTLFSADSGATSSVITYGKSSSIPKAERKAFHRELGRRAKFTPEEQKELETPN